MNGLNWCGERVMLNKLSDMAVIVYVYQTVTVEQAASAGMMVVCLR